MEENREIIESYKKGIKHFFKLQLEFEKSIILFLEDFEKNEKFNEDEFEGLILTLEFIISFLETINISNSELVKNDLLFYKKLYVEFTKISLKLSENSINYIHKKISEINTSITNFKIHELDYKWNYTKKEHFIFIKEEIEKFPLKSTKVKKSKEKANQLKDIILHKNSIQIIESIKVQYKNIHGKRLKLLLMALQELNLIPQERIAFLFHKCCISEFSWDIGSYNAMNDYKFNDKIDTKEKENMKQFIEKLI